MKRLAVLALATVLASSAAAAPRGFSEDRSFHIRLERGACFGTCPAYSVEVDADGAVVFRGDRFVTCLGERRWGISRRAVVRLVAAADRADLFALKDEYRSRITDQPQYRIELTRRGRTKRLTDYVGRSVGMPATVTELEHAVDEIAGTRSCVTLPKAPNR
jgi:hypothetical protein